MSKVIVSDVFGRTEALQKLAQQLNGSVQIIDPYGGAFMNFDDEQEAYQYFITQVGLDSYTHTLLNRIENDLEPVSLIGFSVGASAVWNLSEYSELKHIKSAVLFYGSQIRHKTEVLPRFPVHLIFPKEEVHFSVNELISKINKKKNTQIHRSKYLHGFMNPHSKNYNARAYRQYLRVLSKVSGN